MPVYVQNYGRIKITIRRFCFKRHQYNKPLDVDNINGVTKRVGKKLQFKATPNFILTP